MASYYLYIHHNVRRKLIAWLIHSLTRIPAFLGFSCFAINLIFLQETYAPIILISKAAELRRRTRNWGIHAKQEEIEVDFRELVTKNFTRPLRILFTEPIVLAITLYMSFVYAMLYTSLTAYPLIFQGVYRMNQGVGKVHTTPLKHV